MSASCSSRLALVGFIGGGPGPFGSLQGVQVSGPGNVTLYNGASTSGWSTGTVGVIATNWHFYVLDLERSGSDWILRHSVDGAAFTTEAALTGAAFSNSPSDGGILANGTTEVDDTAIWLDLAAPFTSTELQNLYDLGNTFGEGLDQYSQNFLSTPVCWQATAMMPDGTVWRDSGSGPCPPVVRVPQGAEDVVVTDNGNKVAPRVIGVRVDKAAERPYNVLGVRQLVRAVVSNAAGCGFESRRTHSRLAEKKEKAMEFT